MKNETVLTAQIEAVWNKGMDELIQQFRDLYGFECGDTSIHHLRRRIAYRLQEIYYGGVSDDDLELLDKIADRDPLANLKRNRKKKAMRFAGTKLYRIFRGRQYEVTVMSENEYRFNGDTYKSLSAIARKITGTRWNGKLFFGVKDK